ncbi:MAG: glycosyltransferase [Syntrophomonadaceae bacterium]
MKIMHVITGLEASGAETMLYKLVSGMDTDVFENIVVSMTDLGPIGIKMQADGIRVEVLKMTRGMPDPRYIFQLAALMKREKPDLVQTWLYHSDLLGGIAARIAGIPVIWNIRQCDPRPSGTKNLTWLAANLCARLSPRIPTRIIYCSESAQVSHHALGYDVNKFILIPNGFNLDSFHPDPGAYRSVREELHLDSDQLIVGHAARFHPMKDHKTMLAACSIVHESFPNVHFVLCGEGVTESNEELMRQVVDHRLKSVCHLLGNRNDMPRLSAAFDIACLSSINGEGFPNVIGESMACSVPCVVTDVGDSAAIVGETGVVVMPGSPTDLAKGLIQMIEMGKMKRNLLGQTARQRVEKYYSLSYIVDQYETLYLSINNQRYSAATG